MSARRVSVLPECVVDDCVQPARSRGMCNTHYGRWRSHGDPLAPIKRFGIDTLDRYLDASGDCWIWTRTRTAQGYGQVSVRNRLRFAHRAVYELLVGPIPEGLHLDHLCRNPPCVNPDHLEPVTPAENYRRSPFRLRTHCLRGHEYTPENTISRPTGRHCRACRKATAAEYMREWRARKKAA